MGRMRPIVIFSVLALLLAVGAAAVILSEDLGFGSTDANKSENPLGDASSPAREQSGADDPGAKTATATSASHQPHVQDIAALGVSRPGAGERGRDGSASQRGGGSFEERTA